MPCPGPFTRASCNAALGAPPHYSELFPGPQVLVSGALKWGREVRSLFPIDRCMPRSLYSSLPLREKVTF
ncbi:hypothetical protein Y1Q_0005795 [Alligator mississippiensis]|uniref:Uncharacterized protein n=1 Tax=Alligator mississippiensis TaxID=8496 RepID=A0A151MFX8_ALLMI|nr:hypothetical protein Y1Q_0005795 [Alligator mississippiensis]